MFGIVWLCIVRRFGQVAMEDFFSFEAVGESCILKPRGSRANISSSAQPGAW